MIYTISIVYNYLYIHIYIYLFIELFIIQSVFIYCLCRGGITGVASPGWHHRGGITGVASPSGPVRALSP